MTRAHYHPEQTGSALPDIAEQEGLAVLGKRQNDQQYVIRAGLEPKQRRDVLCELLRGASVVEDVAAVEDDEPEIVEERSGRWPRRVLTVVPAAAKSVVAPTQTDRCCPGRHVSRPRTTAPSAT